MAAEGGAIVTFIFNGQHRLHIPEDVTHLIIHENITVIPFHLFWMHPNLVEVYCHADVTEIEEEAFYECPSLRRVIIPGVIVVERGAFENCYNLMYIECDKLERIGVSAFRHCTSLSCIDFLPSAKIVGGCAFDRCSAMTQAIFGKDLESIGGAFINCSSLESITIPLKNGLFTEDYNYTFSGCVNLKRVNLVEDEYLREFADVLLSEDWRNDMNGLLDSINEIIPNTAAGDTDNDGGKAIAIREWIESVLRKVTHYKAAHRDLLNEAASELQHSLPNDIVMNTVLPFIELPSNTAFDGEHDG